MTSPSPAPPGDAHRSAARRALGLLTDNAALKATAIVLAVLLWLVVGARTPTEGYVTMRIEPTLDSSLVLLDAPPRVRVLVAGRTADLVKLYADPPVLHRLISGDAPDTLMLDVSPTDVHLSPDLSRDVQVMDVQPRTVMLRFSTKATRLVEVVNDGRVVVLGDPRRVRFEPSAVRVTGPRGAVHRLRALHPVALTIGAGDSLPHLTDIDTAGLGVRAHPAQVRVRASGEAGR